MNTALALSKNWKNDPFLSAAVKLTRASGKLKVKIDFTGEVEIPTSVMGNLSPKEIARMVINRMQIDVQDLKPVIVERLRELGHS